MAQAVHLSLMNFGFKARQAPVLFTNVDPGETKILFFIDIGLLNGFYIFSDYLVAAREFFRDGLF